MFGGVLCDMWTTCDLLCCTASILHLLAIAWDRQKHINFIYDQIHSCWDVQIAILQNMIINNYILKHNSTFIFRYWAVTQVNYIHQRNFRTIGTMILLIWLTSVIVSLAPMFGLKDKDYDKRIDAGMCMVRYFDCSIGIQ